MSENLSCTRPLPYPGPVSGYRGVRSSCFRLGAALRLILSCADLGRLEIRFFLLFSRPDFVDVAEQNPPRSATLSTSLATCKYAEMLSGINPTCDDGESDCATLFAITSQCSCCQVWDGLMCRRTHGFRNGEVKLFDHLGRIV